MSNSKSIQQQIAWVYTRDLKHSERFYGDLLGLECIRDEGTARIFRVREGASIGVCETFEGRKSEPAGSMITLVCDDVDWGYRKLLEAGVKTTGEPHILEQFNIYTFFAIDPDGYRIEFQKFLD